MSVSSFVRWSALLHKFDLENIGDTLESSTAAAMS